jgi:hypothetical protein
MAARRRFSCRGRDRSRRRDLDHTRDVPVPPELGDQPAAGAELLVCRVGEHEPAALEERLIEA